VSDLLGSLFPPNWSDPRVVIIVIIIAILALVRRWSYVLLMALFLALAQGLEYLLSNSTVGPEFTKGAVIGVYVFGGILLLFMAIAHFVTKE
jgi:hypothetical protein